jgi:hypothetical protein
MRVAREGEAWADLARRRVDLLAWKEGLLRRAG